MHKYIYIQVRVSFIWWRARINQGGRMFNSFAPARPVIKSAYANGQMQMSLLLCAPSRWNERGAECTRNARIRYSGCGINSAIDLLYLHSFLSLLKEVPVDLNAAVPKNQSLKNMLCFVFH
jgi:hypothetical protein